MDLRLEELTLDMEQAYWDYIKEWESSQEEIVPFSARPLGRDYKTWLRDTDAGKEEATCLTNYVPASTYFLINDKGRILGAVNIRYYLNDNLLTYGGHIGYGVRPSERRKGYAKVMLALALQICVRLNISEVLITCAKDNIGSARTIIANGGVLKDEINRDVNIVTQRYWITL